MSLLNSCSKECLYSCGWVCVYEGERERKGERECSVSNRVSAVTLMQLPVVATIKYLRFHYWYVNVQWPQIWIVVKSDEDKYLPYDQPDSWTFIVKVLVLWFEISQNPCSQTYVHYQHHGFMYMKQGRVVYIISDTTLQLIL